MNPAILLRISSILSVLFAIGHTLGARRSWSPMGDNAVLRSMKTELFAVGGVSRSYWDFFLGFGLLLGAYLLLQAVLLWLLAEVAASQWAVAKPFVVALTIANAVITVLAWRFLIPVPAVFSAVVTLAIGLALVGR